MNTSEKQRAGLFVLGATHHNAPLEVREKLSVSESANEQLHLKLSNLSTLREFSILNTCNRIEFYGVAETEETIRQIQQLFCEQQDFAEDEFAKICLSIRDFDAVQHLLSVASGLDSQLIGETEIFGQIKDSYAQAQERKSAGPVLNKVFQKAFQTAKHVRTNTAITSGQVSVANVAVDLANSIFGELTDTRILLLGAGEIGEKAARAFKSRGAGSITVSSRHLERAMKLASALDATALPFELREGHIVDFDIIVCSTAAPGSIISISAVKKALTRRSARPLFLIDLAMPRDIDFRVGDLPNTYLYNLDDLAAIAEENRSARESEIDKCQLIIAERAETLWKQTESRL